MIKDKCSINNYVEKIACSKSWPVVDVQVSAGTIRYIIDDFILTESDTFTFCGK